MGGFLTAMRSSRRDSCWLEWLSDRAVQSTDLIFFETLSFTGRRLSRLLTFSPILTFDSEHFNFWLSIFRTIDLIGSLELMRELVYALMTPTTPLRDMIIVPMTITLSDIISSQDCLQVYTHTRLCTVIYSYRNFRVYEVNSVIIVSDIVDIATIIHGSILLYLDTLVGIPQDYVFGERIFCRKDFAKVSQFSLSWIMYLSIYRINLFYPYGYRIYHRSLYLRLAMSV